MRTSRPFRPLLLSLFILTALALAGCAVTLPMAVAGEVVEVPIEVVVTATPEPAPPTPEPYQPDAQIIASGLINPRQITYTDDGTLYIAEAGRAGDAQIVVTEDNVVNTGLTSRISMVSPEGEWSVALPGLPSIQTRQGNTGFRGAQAILVTDDAYWVGFGEAPGALLGLTYFRQVLQIDRETWRIENLVDTAMGALAANQPDPDAVNSDPVDLALADDGTLFIVDAGCNCLWSWTETDGRQPFNTWTIDDNPVPTGADIGPDGDIYVSFLSGFPFPVEGARIERWSRDGELVQTYGGLTLATDVLVADDGTIYAVQFAAGLGDQGFIPDSGSVVMVSEEGITPVMEGLRLPYSLAQAPDGSMAVSLVSTGDTVGVGMVVAVPQVD